MSHEVSHETLMRYLDGELPVEARERVEIHLSGCTECRRELTVHREIKERLGAASETAGGAGGSVWASVHRRLTRPLGWSLLVGGGLLWTGWAVYLFATSDAHLLEKLGIGAVAVGLLLLLVAVGAERYRDWKTDPYREIQR